MQTKCSTVMHVRPTCTRSHEEFLCDKLFDFAFGDDEDDLNKALLQASDEFETKITPHATAPSLALALSLQQALPAASQTHFLPVPASTSSTHTLLSL